jgi:hypothetical protein
MPELAIGRLPAVTAAELEAYTAKIAAFEAGAGAAWNREALLLADDAQGGVDFGVQSAAFGAGLLPAFGRTSVEVDPGDMAALRAQVLSAIDSGASVVNYVGHGGLDRIAAEGLVTSGDVAALANGERLPVFSAFTCTINRFDVPGVEPLGSSLVLAPGGGAAAVWAPSGLSENLEGQALSLLYAPRLGQAGLRLGDVVRSSVAAYVDANGASWITQVYNLLGDPALLLKPAPDPVAPPPPAGGPELE